MTLEQQAIAAFKERFGESPQWVAQAPGRVNLIGEHTDYNDGFVFPAAIDRRVVLAASPTSGLTELVSLTADMGPAEPFDANALEPLVSGGEPQQTPGWEAYPKGVAWGLRRLLSRDVSNVRAVVASDLPARSGLSSSAAIEMAFGSLWNAIDGLGVSLADLALVGVEAEHAFPRVPCGIMDQFASALGQAGCAMLLDTRSREVVHAPIPDGVAIVVCDTCMPRELAASKYRVRRAECEEAARRLGVAKLRDVKPDEVDAARYDLGRALYQRAKHVVRENERCLAFADALRGGSLDRAGMLMAESHVSLSDDYKVSSDELDHMAAAAEMAPGCIGARMTGAGFGGACVALVHRAAVDEFIRATRTEYLAGGRAEPQFTVCQASDGPIVRSLP